MKQSTIKEVAESCGWEFEPNGAVIQHNRPVYLNEIEALVNCCIIRRKSDKMIKLRKRMAKREEAKKLKL